MVLEQNAEGEVATMSRLLTLFIPHGGGPCFFMKPGSGFPAGIWDTMAEYLRGLPAP